MSTDRVTPCDEARMALWPDPTRPAASDARAHYDRCPECRDFFRVQSALGERLARMARARAPDELRSRIQEAIAAARPARTRRAWIGVGLAAAAALALAVSLRAPANDDLAMPFATRVAGSFDAEATYRSNDLAQVQAWLAGETGRAVQLPDITDATIMGGRITQLDGRPTATAVYEMHGMPVTYFAVSEGHVAGRDLAQSAGIQVARANGWEVAVWAEPGGIRAVAAPMPRDDVRAIARECRDKALGQAL